MRADDEAMKWRKNRRMRSDGRGRGKEEKQELKDADVAACFTRQLRVSLSQAK